MADKYEKFVASYLRLNGYFIIPNFIVHAPTRISAGRVGNYTETDIVGVRMPYSQEIIGKLRIANHPPLIDGAIGKIDVVVAEVKSGSSNKPNSVWRGLHSKDVGSYIARFVGLHSETDIQAVGDALATTFKFEDQRCRFRYILFATNANAHYQQRGVSYITFEQAISFIVEVRGQCWIDANIGVASCHHQWDDLLVDIFDAANNTELSATERVQQIQSMLAN